MKNPIIILILFCLLFSNTIADEIPSSSETSPSQIEKYKIEKVYNSKISKEGIDSILRNPVDIYRDARFGPNLENGKVNGYKLYQLAKDHFFYYLGARDGDIIVEINGDRLNDTEKMLAIWAKTKSSNPVLVILLRNGKYYKYIIDILEL